MKSAMPLQCPQVNDPLIYRCTIKASAFSVFKPDARHEKSVNEMFDQVIAWGGAMKALREKQAIGR